MTLTNATYSADPADFTVDGVKAGSGEEMEARLAALLAGAAEPTRIADVTLAGVEEGPGWEACVTFAEVAAGVGAILRSDITVAAVVASSPEEAEIKLLDRLVVRHAEVPFTNLAKLEIAGGGIGDSFMALAIMAG